MEMDLSLVRSRSRALTISVREGAPVVELPLTQAYEIPDQFLQFYGGGRQLWDLVLNGEPQVMIHGPAETGKSIASLALMDYLCWQNPGIQASLIRKVAADLPGTVLKSYEGKILKMPQGESDSPYGVHKHGGEHPVWYRYPNGSQIWVGGMDHPGKILSGERDLVLVNQCEELEMNDWETISTRTTGRAGVLRPGRLIGDCNPGPSTHWIIALAEAGVLKMVKSVHQDNPSLFDPETGQITDQGKLSMVALDRLTGVRYKRLRKGLWVAAEGVVYETYDPTTHIRQNPVGAIQYYVAGVDWGFTNPGVIQVWGVDGDGRMYRFEEVYQTGKLVAASQEADAWWINKARELKEKYNIQLFIADPSRPDHIQAFESAGLPCDGGFNAIELGIQNVQSRLVVQKDGLPRIILLSNSRPSKDLRLVETHRPTCLEEELEVYSYPKDATGKAIKEEPVAKDNHACDTMRYVAAYVDDLGANRFMFGRSS